MLLLWGSRVCMAGWASYSLRLQRASKATYAPIRSATIVECVLSMSATVSSRAGERSLPVYMPALQPPSTQRVCATVSHANLSPETQNGLFLAWNA